MSKDPAVLFYTSDFISGTLTMTDAQRGKYIILLCLQHQQGYLTEEDMMNICKTYDEKIFKKFIKSEDGKYFNQRMKYESERRKKYSESRSKNRKNICESYDKHMENENETITESNNKKGAEKKEKPFVPPTIEDVKEYFRKNGYKASVAKTAFEYYSVANWHDKNGDPVKNWKQKMIQVWFKPEHKESLLMMT